MQPFGRYGLLKMCLTLFDLLGSLQVNGNCLKLKFIYDFLYMINSKQGRVCIRLGDTGL